MTDTSRKSMDRAAAELSRARGDGRALFAAVLLFSIFVNLLMLTGPVFMLQVYDRVIASRSEETLVALLGLVAFLYLVMGVLDHARGQLATRAGARFQARLDRRVFEAALADATPGAPGARTPWHDLDSIRRLLGSPAFLALFDVPWTPLFIGVIFVFHPVLGLVALSGAALVAGLTVLNQVTTTRLGDAAASAGRAADEQAAQAVAQTETTRALGMRSALAARWQGARTDALALGVAASERAGLFAATSRTLRLFLQSAILAAGAWLVLRDALTPGAMIATSILLGRALAPLDTAITQWGLVQRARAGWLRLRTLLAHNPTEAGRTALPAPRAALDVQEVTVIPPGATRAALRMVSFRLEPGAVLGVIGPGGSGKSCLARAVTGVWPLAGGSVRLDGAALGQYDPQCLGGAIGYLPQRVSVFDGTVAENIARLQPEPDAEAVIRAARRAEAHALITALPDGYETVLTGPDGGLSGGQLQRIGLARALFGDPTLLVLDEPNAHLDNDGCAAVNAVIRDAKAAGAAVLVMAHRPAAIGECDTLMVLQDGARKALGPRERVLRDMVRNHAEIQSGSVGGVS